MVRILLGVHLLTSGWLCFAQNDVLRESCGKALGQPSFLQQLAIRELRRVVESEILPVYPTDRFVLWGVGRGISPVVASLLQLGYPASTLPVKMNVGGALEAHSQAEQRLHQIVGALLPPAPQLKGKTVVLMTYADDPGVIAGFAKTLYVYLQRHRLAVEGLQVLVLTSHDRLPLFRTLIQSHPKIKVELLPLRLNSRARHWLADLTHERLPSTSEFGAIDLLATDPLPPMLEERHAFAELKALMDLVK